jgi:hypothetical protein
MSRVRPSPAPGSAAAPASRLGRILAGGAHVELRPLELPRGLGRAQVRLPSRREAELVDLAVADWLRQLATERELGEAELVGARMPINKRHALHTVAVAVRDPDDPALPFGSVEEWEQLDEEIVGVAYQAIEDLRAELDPLAGGLTEDEAAAIAEAIKKKDATLLFVVGLPKLVAWLLTTGDPPAS